MKKGCQAQAQNFREPLVLSDLMNMIYVYQLLLQVELLSSLQNIAGWNGQTVIGGEGRENTLCITTKRSICCTVKATGGGQGSFLHVTLR